MSKQIPYWQQRQQLKLQGKKPEGVKKTERREKAQFFADQLVNAPKYCENCKKPLAGTMAINPAAVVAHIIPKNPTSGCPSVAVHPDNRWFACGDCHTDYDNRGAEYVKAMPIFAELKRRVSLFYDKIAQAERRRVPQYFRPRGK
jgi:hypothetical protein